MSQKKIDNNQITNGIIWKEMLKFVVPIAAGTLFQQLYNTFDAIIVGRFVGKAALASVGGSPAVVTNMLINFFTGLTAGAAVVVSQQYGAKEEKKLQISLHTAYLFSILLGIGVTIVGWFVAPALLRFMKTPKGLMSDSVTYLRVYLLGMVAILTYNMGAAIIRAIGDSKRPLYFLGATSVLNVGLDLLLIVVLKMGIIGAAVATVVSQYFCAILVIYSLRFSYESMKLRLSELRIHGATLLEELRIGLPGAMQFCVFAVTNMLLQIAWNNLGTNTIAAFAIFGKVDMIFWAVNTAFGVAVTTFVGQNYGAKKMDRVFRSVRVGMGLSCAIGITILGGLIVFCAPIYRLFTSDQEVIRVGCQMMNILAPCYTLGIFVEIITGALRGFGDVLFPTSLTIGGTLLVRLPWILFVTPKFRNVATISISYPLSWVPHVFLLFPYYLYRKKILKRECQ